VQMVRQYDDRINRERMPRAHIAKCLPQQSDSLRKQACAAVGQGNREEEVSAGNQVAPVISHRRMLERPGRVKQADRWVSPGSTHPTICAGSKSEAVGWVEASAPTHHLFATGDFVERSATPMGFAELNPSYNLRRFQVRNRRMG